MTMPEAVRVRFGRWMTGISIIVILVSLAAVAMLGRWEIASTVLAPTNGLLGAGFGALAWTVLPKQPRNGAVWTYAWISFFAAIFVGFLLVLVSTAPSAVLDNFDNPDLTGTPFISEFAVSIMLWAWIPATILPLTLGLLLFPDGQPPSPRWRWVGWLTIGTMSVAVVAQWVLFSPWSTVPMDTYETPLGMVVESLLIALSVIGLVCVASLIVRYRRGGSQLRRQVRWIAVGGLLFIVGDGFVIATAGGFSISGDDVLITAIYVITTVVLVGSFWVAITRYRLYDIDIVISKSLTYGALAVFITGVYALVVVGIGSVVGGGDEPSLALSITAVAVVAVAFEPVRRRVQHWANVVVYGKRATPYEVLASATARLSDTSDPDEALAMVAQLVVDGTGALEAVLWLKVGDVMYPRASSPEGVMADLGPVSGEDAVAVIPGDRVVAVRHRGDVLGALSISKGRGDAVTGPDEKVLEDVAAGAGVLLRNMGLNAELAERAEQLRVSRRRLVAAQDAERRRLERDLHDGAQQQVVALKVKLGIARTLAEREGAESVAGLVASLSDTTQEAVDGMRAVAHGIYPPLLEAEGLEAALASARRTIAIAVDFAAERIVRYDRSVEESIYFCVLGVVAEAADAGATRVTVRLHGGPDAVRFSVDADSAVGDLVAVEDRVDALNGTVHIDRGTGRTVVAGELPARSRSLEPA